MPEVVWSHLTVELFNLSDDVDQYVKDGSWPTPGEYECRPYAGGINSESCTLPNTGSIFWYIGVQGYQAGSYEIKAISN